MLMVEAVDIDEADTILQERGIWAFYDDTTDGLLKAGVSRTIEMQRESAKRYGLNIWDDGYIDNPTEQKEIDYE